MKVRLTGSMSGTRDGQDWPPRGSTIDLPDDEATALCQNGMARPVVDDQVETAVPDDVDVEPRGLTTSNGPGRRGRKQGG